LLAAGANGIAEPPFASSSSLSQKSPLSVTDGSDDIDASVYNVPDLTGDVAV
jgi:hypothetical protein